MGIFHERYVRQARTPHTCDWCGDGIETGQPYFAYRWSDGVDSGSVSMHPECYQAMQDDDYVALNCSFRPFDHCRGCSCERPRCECGKQTNGMKQDEIRRD